MASWEDEKARQGESDELNLGADDLVNGLLPSICLGLDRDIVGGFTVGTAVFLEDLLEGTVVKLNYCSNMVPECSGLPGDLPHIPSAID